MLRQTTRRDLSVSLFGRNFKCPIIMAPIGVQAIYHPDRELGSAEVAANLGIPYIHSTAATSTIEEVASANRTGPRWFQLYWPHDKEVTKSLLSRAKENNYDVLVVTLDTWTLAWRPADLDLGYVPFLKGIGDQTGFSDPVFRQQYKENTGMEIEDDIDAAAAAWNADIFSGQAHTWDDIAFLQKHWDGPIVLKGIQHVDDAKMALELGIQGIVVSNHGGRQLDGAVGSLEVLPEIVDAVGNGLTVLFDSGVRTGADILKALCLGAKAVLIGRPWVYGLGISGKEGALDVLTGLLAVKFYSLLVRQLLISLLSTFKDLDLTLGLTGLRSVHECNRAMLRRVQYGGDVFLTY